MNNKPLRRYQYQDAAKEAPLYCPCGMIAPGEIVEYYRYYHVLGCMRCRTHLAMVDHPISTEFFDGLWPVRGDMAA